jgi:hypothetical protein
MRGECTGRRHSPHAPIAHLQPAIYRLVFVVPMLPVSGRLKVMFRAIVSRIYHQGKADVVATPNVYHTPIDVVDASSHGRCFGDG